MKYYCVNCGSVFEIEEGFEHWVGEICPICRENRNLTLKKLPAFEPVFQWEKRTGRKYSDTAPVYTQRKSEPGLGWFLKSYRGDLEAHYIIVATEAGAPPDDWRPEEEK